MGCETSVEKKNYGMNMLRIQIPNSSSSTTRKIMAEPSEDINSQFYQGNAAMNESKERRLKDSDVLFSRYASFELESGVKCGAFGQMSIGHQQLTTVEANLHVSLEEHNTHHPELESGVKDGAFGSNNKCRRPELFEPILIRYDEVLKPKPFLRQIKMSQSRRNGFNMQEKMDTDCEKWIWKPNNSYDDTLYLQAVNCSICGNYVSIGKPNLKIHKRIRCHCIDDSWSDGLHEFEEYCYYENSSANENKGYESTVTILYSDNM